MTKLKYALSGFLARSFVQTCEDKRIISEVVSGLFCASIQFAPPLFIILKRSKKILSFFTQDLSKFLCYDQLLDKQQQKRSEQNMFKEKYPK